MVDKIQSPLIDTSLAPVKGAISNSDYVFVRGADESIEKVLVSDLLAGTAGAIRIRGEADMDNASTTPTSVVIIGDPNNATMEQGVAPVNTSPNGVAYVVKTAQSGVQTQISGTTQTVFDGDQIIWSGSKWSILALGNAVTSVDNQTGAVNLEDKYYWTGNKPNIEDIPNLQGTLDSKYSPTNKPTPAEIGAKANSYIPDWEEVTNKPDTSTRWPSFAEVTSKPTTATRWPTFSEVTSKPATATRWPAFSEVTGKPTTYTPSAHTHPAAQVTGLGTAATKNVGVNNGELVIAGTPTAIAALDRRTINPNNLGGNFSKKAAFFFTSRGGLVSSTSNADYGDFLALDTYSDSSGGYINGLFFNKNHAGVIEIFRAGKGDTNWYSVGTLYHTGNMPATATRWPTFAEVTDKPTTFAPSAHTHPWSQVTGAPAQATRWPTFAEVTGKPTNYATTWASVDAKPATATRWPTWSEVTGKPTTFVADWGDITSIPVYATRWPNKAEVGLSNVPNYTISNATNDPSTNKFASTAAVYSVSQRVATLEGSSTGVDVYDGTDPKNTKFPIGTTLIGKGPELRPNTHTVLYTYDSSFSSSHYFTTSQGSTSKQLSGVWAARGKVSTNNIYMFQRIS